MPNMSAEEQRQFLATGTRTAKLAVVRADGRPHVTPIWFVLDDDGSVLFTTAATSVKGKALRRDPRLTFCVDDQVPPFSFVMVEGTAEIGEDLDEMLLWATRIGARYMGEEEAERFGRRNAVPGELLVRVRPSHVVAAKDLAD
jgi:PPOX class probable F420-dependent enzyme